MKEVRRLTDVRVGMQLACERLCLLKDLSKGSRLRHVTDTQNHLPVRPVWQPTSCPELTCFSRTRFQSPLHGHARYLCGQPNSIRSSAYGSKVPHTSFSFDDHCGINIFEYKTPGLCYWQSTRCWVYRVSEILL